MVLTSEEVSQTGKTRTTKATLLSEYEEWYQYTPSFKRHSKKGKKVPGTVKKPTSNIIRLLKSPFEKRPDTIFFNYPKYVDQDKKGAHLDE